MDLCNGEHIWSLNLSINITTDSGSWYIPPNGRKHLGTLYNISRAERWAFNLVIEATVTGSPPPSLGSVTGGKEDLAAGSMMADPSLPKNASSRGDQSSEAKEARRWTGQGDTHALSD